MPAVLREPNQHTPGLSWSRIVVLWQQSFSVFRFALVPLHSSATACLLLLLSVIKKLLLRKDQRAGYRRDGECCFETGYLQTG